MLAQHPDEGRVKGRNVEEECTDVQLCMIYRKLYFTTLDAEEHYAGTGAVRSLNKFVKTRPTQSARVVSLCKPLICLYIHTYIYIYILICTHVDLIEAAGSQGESGTVVGVLLGVFGVLVLLGIATLVAVILVIKIRKYQLDKQASGQCTSELMPTLESTIVNR